MGDRQCVMTKERQSLANRLWGALVLLSFALVLGTGYVLCRPAMPRSLVQQLRPGMTQTEVKIILGSPQNILNGDWPTCAASGLGVVVYSLVRHNAG
jgi:hypothetical protein